MATRNREGINLTALHHVKLVSQVRAQAGARATLTEAIDAGQSHVGQVVLLGDFAMQLRAELKLIALIQ